MASKVATMAVPATPVSATANAQRAGPIARHPVRQTQLAFTNLSPAMEPAFPDMSIVKISQ